MSGDFREKDLAVLLAAYHELGGQIAQHEIDIQGLRHKQAILIALMHELDMPYRTLAPMLGISKSRVQQRAESTALRPSG